MIEQLPIANILPDPENVRQTGASDAHNQVLAANIREMGLLQPILVRDDGTGGYVVVAGHRRLAAVTSLGWSHIPAIVTADHRHVLMQASENMVRAQMSPLDIWNAVARMIATGMSAPSVAAALNLTERGVAQLVAMGSMAPCIVEAIRKNPDDMPSDRDVATICQATHARQAEAFEQHGAIWWRLARALEIQSIPMSHARFDPELYTGPLHTDLFGDPDLVEAEDTALFLKLQEDWSVTARAKAADMGFLIGVRPTGAYGSHKPPIGAQDFARPATNMAKMKKADRGKLIYTVTIDADGRVHEQLWPVKEKAVATEASATLMSPVTSKGLAAIEIAKREAVTESLGELGADDLMMIAALCIMSMGCRGDIDATSVFDEHGQMRRYQDGEGAHVLDAALVACLSRPGFNAKVPLTIVERIGQALLITPELEPSMDNLAFLKKPALTTVLAGLRRDLGHFKTQAAARDYINKNMRINDAAITPALLPALGWSPERLPFSWSVPRPNGADADASDDDDDQNDDDGPEMETDEAA